MRACVRGVKSRLVLSSLSFLFFFFGACLLLLLLLVGAGLGRFAGRGQTDRQDHRAHGHTDRPNEAGNEDVAWARPITKTAGEGRQRKGEGRKKEKKKKPSKTLFDESGLE